ncbi:TonB-dependent receptor plug domain-containing protein [Thauera sp. Sel9]|uniref:TonB-dependent receptor plug domain-containing protein n=1 Tax=Thauera sp. Sel9 TaxID=2974299 RepID=UPI0021E14752|nr:TonB-dependent receptor [Thauera sp. Sel9]MCV2217613.1 TonB-dependent receptor [Thauera sp. Sel9]
MKKKLLCCSIAMCFPLAIPGAVHAAQDERVFTLGQITVTGRPDDASQAVGTSTISREQMDEFGREDLLDALDLLPGVSISPGSGSRNEGNFRIRGYDSWRVPLMMDGIRLYLPYDNRIDIGRFLTPDLSEIQVSKGYVSVLNGPGGMGGAINLVTRKPVKTFEAEGRVSMLLGEGGQRGGMTYYANVGGKQQDWYWQASFEQRDIDHWRMSRDYKSTSMENGGDRNRSDSDDKRLNLKLGYTPNGTDEYSINFVKQEGEKSAILSTRPGNRDRDWDWPKWDVWSLYWLSHTQLSDTTYLKTKAYYNQFDNELMMHNFDTLSTYDDTSYGLSLEAGTTWFTRNTLKAAVHYRNDQHTGQDKEYSPFFLAPKQDAEEETWSFGLENTFHATSRLDLIAGVSYDTRDTKKVEQFSKGQNPEFFEYETKDKSAWNYQGAVVYRYSDSGRLNFSASRRISMPTMFHRFSSRFGGATSNPGLKPEKAMNFELALSDRIGDGWFGEIAFFHNEIDDLMQGVDIEYPAGSGRFYTQNQNVGKGSFKGVELSLNGFIEPTLEVGGNYTYTHSDIDLDRTAVNSTLTRNEIPRHAGMLYAKWTPTAQLSVMPYIESASSRWSPHIMSGNADVKTGSYTLANLRVGYQVTSDLDVSLTARNLFDKNYELKHSYPEEGRNFMLTARIRY